MEIVDAKAVVMGKCPSTWLSSLQHIEEIARICYKSEDKITDDSATGFLRDKIVGPGHTAMMEHSWRAISFEKKKDNALSKLPFLMVNSPFILVDDTDEDIVYIAANFRAWVEFFQGYFVINERNTKEWHLYSTIDERIEVVMDEVSIPFEFVDNESLPLHLQTVTCKFTVGRDISHELVRHRPFTSFAQESQRYVGYQNKCMKYVEPYWFKDASEDAKNLWVQFCLESEITYKELRKNGLSPQDARVVLPNSMCTEIVITAPMFQWSWIFHLRTSAAAYPQMRYVMTQAQTQIEDIL